MGQELSKKVELTEAGTASFRIWRNIDRGAFAITCARLSKSLDNNRYAAAKANFRLFNAGYMILTLLSFQTNKDKFNKLLDWVKCDQLVKIQDILTKECTHPTTTDKPIATLMQKVKFKLHPDSMYGCRNNMKLNQTVRLLAAKVLPS